MGFPFVLGVVLDDDFLVHDDSSLSVQIMIFGSTISTGCDGRGE